jgi:hypothetical protein
MENQHFILGNQDFARDRWRLNEESYDNAVFSLMSDGILSLDIDSVRRRVPVHSKPINW